MFDRYIQELDQFFRDINGCTTKPRQNGFAIATKLPLRWLRSSKCELGLVRAKQNLFQIALNCEKGTFLEEDVSRHLLLPRRAPRQIGSGVRVRTDGRDPWDMIEIYLSSHTLAQTNITEGKFAEFFFEVARRAVP